MKTMVKIFLPKQNFGFEKFWFEKMFGQKNFGFEKMKEKFWVKEILGPKQISGRKDDLKCEYKLKCEENLKCLFCEIMEATHALRNRVKDSPRKLPFGQNWFSNS